MKHLILIAFTMTFFAIQGCATTKSGLFGKNKSVQKLEKNLMKWQKRGYLVGHQDDPVYGTTWKWDYGKSDVKSVCGEYPAIMGFDLGMIELGSDKNLDGVPFSRIRQEIINQYTRGGVVTISWHPHNPVTGKSAWDNSGNAVKAVLYGGAQHSKFEIWLNAVAQFINSLRTADGRKIPVIFRPWHEMSGSWFWWGSKSCTTDNYISLYQMTSDYMKSRGVNNMLYCFSPNSVSNDNEEHFLKYYPGDEYVDIIGVDIYQFDKTGELYAKNLNDELNLLTKIGKEHNKLVCLAETGYRNTPDSTWFTKILKPVIDKYPISYMLLWRNAWDQPEENFGPAPEKSCAKDFREFYKADNTLFVNDIK